MYHDAAAVAGGAAWCAALAGQPWLALKASAREEGKYQTTRSNMFLKGGAGGRVKRHVGSVPRLFGAKQRINDEMCCRAGGAATAAAQNGGISGVASVRSEN